VASVLDSTGPKSTLAVSPLVRACSPVEVMRQRVELSTPLDVEGVILTDQRQTRFGFGV
jgi:hypothetical protein